MIVSPCKGCEKRRIGCHENCPDYGAWAAEVIRRREARAKESENKMMREGMRKSLVKKAARQRQWREK